MNSKSLTIAVLLLVVAGWTLVVAGSTAAVGDSSYAQSDDEISGVSVGPVSDDVDSEINITKVNQLLEAFGYAPPEEVTWITTENDAKHLVFSDDPIPAGKATVSGQQISVPGIDQSIVFADEFEVERTGERVSFDEFESNTADYAYDVVELESSVRIGAVAAKPDDSNAVKLSVATVDSPDAASEPALGTAPGQYARQAAINLSERDLEELVDSESILGVGEFKAASFDHQYWGSGVANTTVAVVPRYEDRPFREPELVGYDLVLVDVDYDAEELEDPAELADHGQEYHGETVTIESDVVASTTSPQELLTSTVSCGGKTIWVPGTPTCVPLVVDSVVHAGVAVSVDDGVSTVPYAGLSNEIQRSITDSETGRYEITGTVVDASEVAWGADAGIGLVVSDAERVGDATLEEDAEAVAETRVQEMTDRIRTQINTSGLDWNDGSDGTDEGDDSGDGEGDDGNESDGADSGGDGESDGSGSGDDGDDTGDGEGSNESDGGNGTGEDDGETDGETDDGNESDESEPGNESDAAERPDACLEAGASNATAGFVLENASIGDADLTVGENTTVTLSVVSCHRETANASVTVTEDGDPIDASRNVALEPGDSETVRFQYGADDAGEFELATNGTATDDRSLLGTVDVTEAESTGSDDSGAESNDGETDANEDEEADSDDGDDPADDEEDPTEDDKADSAEDEDDDPTDDESASGADDDSTGAGSESDADGGNSGDGSASDGGASSDGDGTGSENVGDGAQSMPGFGIASWLLAAAIFVVGTARNVHR